jgi:hypothetical protein
MAAKTGTYTLINSQTLSSNAGIVTFASIPQTFTDLVLVVSAKSSFATYDISAIRVNSVTTGYSKTYLEASGSAATSGRATAEISLRAGYLPGTNYTSEFSADTYHFFDYANTTTYKTVLCRCNAYNTSTSFNVQIQASLIPTTSAITQITVQTANGSNLVAGSTFKLYGIEAGNL